jgi:hypothetical protein
MLIFQNFKTFYYITVKISKFILQILFEVVFNVSTF